jgi:hypothetical protein
MSLLWVRGTVFMRPRKIRPSASEVLGKSQKPADLFVVNFVCALRGDQFGLDLL